VTETIEPMTTAQIDQQQLAEELVDKARAEGVELLGQGGLLTGLMKSVFESALDGQRREPGKRSGELVGPGPGVLDAEPVAALAVGKPAVEFRR
jgi:hypothetical protein